MATEDAEEPEHDTGTSQDTETDGDTTDTDAGGVMAVDVEGLRGPEHDNGEEIGAGDEGDDQCQSEDARFLLQARWKHGELGALDFPDCEGDHERGSEEKRNEHMSGGPFVLLGELAGLRGGGSNSPDTNLVSSPLQSTEEKDHSDDAQNPTDEINFVDNFPS